MPNCGELRLVLHRWVVFVVVCKVLNAESLWKTSLTYTLFSYGENEMKPLPSLAVALMILAIMFAAAEVSQDLRQASSGIGSLSRNNVTEQISQNPHPSSQTHMTARSKNEQIPQTCRLTEHTGQLDHEGSPSEGEDIERAGTEARTVAKNVGQLRAALTDLIAASIKTQKDLLRVQLGIHKEPHKESEVEHADQ